MSSFLAGLFGVLALGVIAAGVVNQWDLAGFHLPAWAVCASLAALYLLGWLLHAQGGAEPKGPVRAWLSRCHTALVLLVGLALFASIPAIWWGVIKRLASGAVKGS